MSKDDSFCLGFLRNMLLHDINIHSSWHFNTKFKSKKNLTMNSISLTLCAIRISGGCCQTQSWFFLPPNLPVSGRSRLLDIPYIPAKETMKIKCQEFFQLSKSLHSTTMTQSISQAAILNCFTILPLRLCQDLSHNPSPSQLFQPWYIYNWKYEKQ